VEVWKDPVDSVGAGRAGRAAGLVVRAEHEVVDEELGATIEQLREGPGALIGIERVFLLDLYPGQLATLPREIVAEPRVLLLPPEQLLPRGQPVLAAPHLVVGHRLPPRPSVS
jgi:hypothetical protein